MDLYDAAAHDWWLRCEAATYLYRTEAEEFARAHPPPQLKRFMVDLSGEWQQRAA